MNLSESTGEQSELVDLLKEQPNDAVILNIGSLSKNLRNLHPWMINLDISRYENVDLIGDATHLLFCDECVDLVLFKNVLEHIKGPQMALNQIERVLKKGAYLYLGFSS
jgi:predicted SAM-dependent methyltransferase